MIKKLETIFRRTSALMLALILLCTCFALPAAAAKQNPAVEAANAVVRVVAMNPFNGMPAGFGSAFGIAAKEGDAPQYFVTNWHVVHPEIQVAENTYARFLASQVFIMKSDLAVSYDAVRMEYVLESSQLIPCEVVFEGEQYPDMAIIRAAEPYQGRTNLPIRLPREEADRGNTVYALGFPGANDDTSIDHKTGVFSHPADVEDVSITSGVFSHMAAMKTYNNTIHIEHDARINHGNSGGPLVDAKGAVIGINTYGLTAGAVTSFYSVSSQYIISTCDSLNIPYRLATESGPDILPIVLIAVGVLAAAVVVILLLKRGKKNSKPADPVIPQQNTGLQIMGVQGIHTGRTFQVNGTMKFGRRPTNQVVFPEGTGGVSGEHCQIWQESGSGRYCIVDLNSSFGTYVNNQRINPGVPVQLYSGMVFTLGSQEQMFRVL